MSDDAPPAETKLRERRAADAPASTPADRTTILGVASGVWLVGVLAACVVLLSLGGDRVTDLLRYERSAVLHGEYWRLLTGHLVHGSASHLILNLAGLGLIAALFPRHYRNSHWLLIALGALLSIDLGFVLNEPQLDWYVGLSGLLHGVLAGGAVAWWRYETRSLAFTLTLILVLKLAWEQWRGALPLSGDMSVIVDAHLYGALGGSIVALLLLIAHRHWPAALRSL